MASCSRMSKAPARPRSPTGESRLVRDEETEYRMEPSWAPDGANILYVTEDEGSNDIRVIAAAGGEPIELTLDTTRHEMSPAVSPDGTRFAFVQYDAGVPALYVAQLPEVVRARGAA
jgi:Tol biopolymer transport system component